MIPPILSVLSQRAGQVVDGQDIPVWEIPDLEGLVLEMRVHRGAGRGASLHVMEMTEVRDQTLTLIEKKFGQSYKSSAPIELVAYYITEPPSDRAGAMESVADFLSSNLDGSPFRRVWLFNHPGWPLAADHGGGGGDVMAGVYAELRSFFPAHLEWASSKSHDGPAGAAPIIGSMGGPATGFLHITRVHGDTDPVNAEYRIVFAPLGGRLRGRHAQCQGLDALTDFLRQAGVPLPEIARAWQHLARRQISSVPRIALTPARLEVLGL